ncbi:ATP-binding protein [Phytoactinopolyspora endophytica]|uniref:ATP-binding protein n=1 Tax=Phytoactinopolyspora endophytica TaxID=1642495 RepID=UPI00101BF744|nr:helix-turn-helix domain-containing protein [Phytoactinopolyspora endophytica]
MLNFAALLRQHRLAAGLSQEELARQAGLSGDAVAALERGRRRNPRPLTVRLLTEALELSDDERAIFIAAAHGQQPPAREPIQPAPVYTAGLVGRDGELATSIQLLTDAGTRLLTLTGPGGIGKTRLAMEVSAGATHAFTHGVRWVTAGACTDASTLYASVANALGLSLPADRGPELLAEYLGDRAVLLVLDSCEHVISAAVKLCATLLRSCPRLAILATSREVLRVPGETVRAVRPLSEAESARLFIGLAESHGIRPAPRDMDHIDRLCHRLDGIPLAIELAAARVNVLTVEELATEIATSFRILSAGSRTAPQRQQSLDATIQWSYDLLTADEQSFLAAVSVFSDGWTMPAAQALCHGLFPRSASSRAVDMTGSLVDKSLITVRRDGAAARYGMFQAVREFAEAKLERAGHQKDIEHRHLTYYVRLAVNAAAEMDRAGGEPWLAAVGADIGNLRAAWRRAVIWQRRTDATRLAGTVATYCRLRGLEPDWRIWSERAQASGDL